MNRIRKEWEYGQEEKQKNEQAKELKNRNKNQGKRAAPWGGWQRKSEDT